MVWEVVVEVFEFGLEDAEPPLYSIPHTKGLMPLGFMPIL